MYFTGCIYACMLYSVYTVVTPNEFQLLYTVLTGRPIITQTHFVRNLKCNFFLTFQFGDFLLQFEFGHVNTGNTSSVHMRMRRYT